MRKKDYWEIVDSENLKLSQFKALVKKIAPEIYKKVVDMMKKKG